MDLRRTLIKEHSAVNTRKVVDYVGTSAVRFKALVEVLMAGPYRVTQRAAWPLSYCVEGHPELIKPHFKTLLDMLKQPDTHVAVRRNIVRLLQFVEIPARYRGRVATVCFDLLQDRKEPIAVRVFAMTVLANLVVYEPELGKELTVIIEDNLPYGSPGFVSRGRKILKRLE
jgi:hypothetical protein